METITAMSARSLQYYVIARHWLSDLDFYRIETSFLYRLLDDYFTRLADRDHIERFGAVSARLIVLETDEKETRELLTRQLKKVELMAEDVIPESADELAAAQVKLEYLITNLTAEYREVKKELFDLVESVMLPKKQLLA